jgi:hypothetical protein
VTGQTTARHSTGLPPATRTGGAHAPGYRRTESSMPVTSPETPDGDIGPDFSVCGRPLIDLIGHDHLDEHIERAAIIALEADPLCGGIVVCTWAEYLENEANTWLRRQRQHLAAWRTTTVTQPGRLKLRSRRIVKPGQPAPLAVFVQWHPTRVRKIQPSRVTKIEETQ